MSAATPPPATDRSSFRDLDGHESWRGTYRLLECPLPDGERGGAR